MVCGDTTGEVADALVPELSTGEKANRGDTGCRIRVQDGAADDGDVFGSYTRGVLCSLSCGSLASRYIPIVRFGMPIKTSSTGFLGDRARHTGIRGLTGRGVGKARDWHLLFKPGIDCVLDMGGGFNVPE